MKHNMLAILMLFVMICLSGCGADNKTQEVHIGYFNNITHAQALLMKSDQALENALGEDVKVTWTAFNAGPAEVEALFAEDIDIGYIGPVPAITANVKSKGDVKILSGATKGGSVLIGRNGCEINTLDDLSGKTVAIPQIGNTQHLSLLQLLSENDLSPVTDGGDVKVSAVANADVANVMNRGDIDAALVPEPWGATLLQGDTYLILDYDDIYMDGNYDVAVVVVRSDFMEKHQDIVETFMEQHAKATESINSDVESAIAKINEELLQATGKALTQDIITEAFGRIGVSTGLNKESISGFADISFEQGFIQEIPGEEQLYVSDIE